MLATPEVIRKKARDAHAKQQLLIAEQHYRTLLKEDPDVEDVVNLGAILRSQGRLQEGSLFYQEWVQQFNRDKRLALNACNCWNDNNEAYLSIVYLEGFIQKEKANRELLICYSDSLYRLNRLQECIDILHQCFEHNQEDKKIWVRIGLSYAKSRNLNNALDAFEQANKIDPNDLEVTSNRITVLKDLGRLRDAELLINNLSPEKQLDVNIAQATAGLLMEQNKLVEATYFFRRICEEKPEQANYWLNWAAALRGLRWTVAPYKILQRALCYEPLNENVQEALMQILAEMAKNNASQRCMALWPKDSKHMKDIYLFNRQFLGIGTSQYEKQYLADQAREWERKCQSKKLTNLWKDSIQPPPKNRKLRVGYLSADFANHPVGRFLLPILSNHDKEVVELWALSTGSHQDWITDHLRERVDHWIDLRFLSTSECGRVIADLGLDILVELGGFSADSRLEILCHRPAPVQLSYLGYPGPTYLRCIDGWIGDKILFGQLDPIDRSAHQIIEIEGGYMAFDTGGELPMPKRTAGSHFRFGSFNHSRKLTSATIDLFCKVMAANPDAELALKSISFCEPAEQQRIRRRFEQAGLESSRLVLMDWVEGGLNHLQLYSEIDVALDPIPYGGATTTAEALWMGVPVVALAGQGMVGRLAASLLVNGNQEQWVARDENEYIKIATDLADKGPRSKEIRYELRRRLQQSPLADGNRLSKELEKYYLKIRQDAETL